MGLAQKQEIQDSSKETRPSIYDFHDYRVFLRAYLAWSEQQNTSDRYSLRATSMRAGFNESYLPLVLRGHRNLTEKAQEKLLAVLKLNEREKSFFRLLVQLADSADDESKKQAIGAIKRFKKFISSNEGISESYQYLSQWQNVVIREMVELPGFKLDPQWIRSRLKNKVSISAIKKSIAFLVKNHFIEFDDNGNIKNQQHTLDCTGGIYKIALNEFHKQMFQLAIKAKDNSHRDHRLIDAVTIAVSEEEIQRIKSVLSSAIDEVLKITQEKAAVPQKKEMVFHVAFVGFPAAGSKDEG